MITNNLIIVLKYRANISNRNSNLDRNQSHTGWNWFMTICQQKPRAGIHRDPGWNLKYLECPKLCNSSHPKKNPHILSKNQARWDGDREAPFPCMSLRWWLIKDKEVALWQSRDYIWDANRQAHPEKNLCMLATYT